ncbi:MAG: YitT family protein [Psychrilyobacter sp.]|uniref:YitT family protein n=1 Tax=Psychrilyobacter sp. TaxID=2586924 RepID=UPI003C782560
MSKRKKHLTEFLFINLGFFIAAMGITNFLGPAKFTAGGFTGLAILINTLFSNFSIAQAMLLLNIPVFILGAIIIGKKYALTTTYALILFPFYEWFTHSFLRFVHPATDGLAFKFIAVVAGAICIGIGIGLAVAFGSNTGGTVIVAQIFNRLFNFPVGNVMMVADSIVILISAYFLGFDTVIYAVICSLLIGKTVNFTIAKSKKFQESFFSIA